MDDRHAPRALPSVGHLLEELGDDLSQNPGGWLLAGLAFTLVTYAIPVLAAGLLLVLLIPAAMVGREAGGFFLLSFLLITLLASAAIAPFLASFYRAARDHLHRRAQLTFSAPFRSLGQDVGSGILVTLAVGALVALGSMLFVLPGLILAWLLMWSLPLVFLHRRGVGEAFAASFDLARRDPGWTLLVALIGVGIVVIAGAVPVVGPMVMMPIGVLFHARAFEAAFGVEPLAIPPEEYARERQEIRPGPPIEI